MEDEASISLDSKSLTNLRVVDLKEELDKRGLSKSGSKKDLIKRLKQQLEFEKLSEERKLTGSCDLNLQLDAVTEQNEFVQQYLAQQQKIYAEQQEMKRLIELEASKVDEGEKCDNLSTNEASSEMDEESMQEAETSNECSTNQIKSLNEENSSSLKNYHPKEALKLDEDRSIAPDSTLSNPSSPEGCSNLSSERAEMEQAKTFPSVPYSLADIQLPESPDKSHRPFNELNKGKSSRNYNFSSNPKEN